MYRVFFLLFHPKNVSPLRKSQTCSFQKNEKSLSNRSGPNCSSPKGRKKLRYPKGSYPAEEQFKYFNFFNENLLKVET